MYKIDDLIDFENNIYNWEKIEEIPDFQLLTTAEQNPKWHSEGNAMIHTKKVCEAMVNIIENKKNISSVKKKVLLTSALFHDIGKGVTTEFKKGNWHSYGHEIEGEKITRRILWNEDIIFRESVCKLVRWHMEPLNLFKSGNFLEKGVILYNNVMNPFTKEDLLKDLLLLKKCDCLGAICKENNIKILKESLETLETIHKLNLGHVSECVGDTILGRERDYDSIVIVMIGLPGSGKDTYIKNTLGKLVNNVVSRDEIRVELGYTTEDKKIIGTSEQEDKVSEIFNNRMIEYAKNKQNFIINNINLKKKYRDDYKKLLKEYRIKWVYLYVEAKGIKKNIERRKDSNINLFSYMSMIDKFDWPDVKEYDNFLFSFN